MPTKMTRRSPRYARLSIALSATSLACMSAGAASAAEPSAKKPAEAEGSVLLVGSSSMNDAFGHLMASSLEQDGFRVERKGYASAGLSRPDFRDMVKTLADLPVSGSTDAVLVYLGGNDAQALFLRPEERPAKSDGWVRWSQAEWSDVYVKRVQTLVEGLCKRGAKKVIVLPPVDVVGDKMQAKLDRIRKLQEEGAASTSCGVAVSTAGDRASLRGDGAHLRAKDGIHMSPEGAARVWKRIETKVLELIPRRG